MRHANCLVVYALLAIGLPAHQLQMPIMVFDKGGVAFNPITIIAVQNAVDIAHFCMVDMAAHDTLQTPAAGLCGHGHFKVADIGQGFFDPTLEVGRQ